MKNVVIMGSTGRLGRMLQYGWSGDQGKALHPIYQFRNTAAFQGNATCLCWSLEDGPAAFAGALAAVTNTNPSRETVMVILAGVTPTSTGCMEDNAIITSACLEAARHANIKRVLVASSSAVYGTQTADEPLAENDELKPLNPYGRQKQIMEELCAQERWNDLEISLLRIGNVAGADALILNYIQEQGRILDLDVFENGKSVQRSYIGPETLADVIRTLVCISDPLPDIINLSAPTPIYMDDLAQAAGIKWRPRTAAAGARQAIILNTTRLEALHHFRPCDSRPSTMMEQVKAMGILDDLV